MNPFDFSPEERKSTWSFLIDRLEEYYENTGQLRVSPSLNVEEIRSYVSELDFNNPGESMETLEHVLQGMKEYIVHTPHPSYYGLFNPRASFPGILADVITAVFNPQMAAWSHSPYATEAENYSIRELGRKFGYSEHSIDGTFCSGGAEANITAVLTGLTHMFPSIPIKGIRNEIGQPIIYCSAEAHHSIARGVRVSGVGMDNLRSITVDNKQQIIPGELERAIRSDLASGLKPCMIIANAGSTGTGAIDPLEDIAGIAEKYNIWFHADAAYGGAIVVDENMKSLLSGIELADSITVDIHKWFSVPMGAGLFLTRHTGILSETFSIAADYMPKEASDMEIIDPYTHSIQWSRRFIGLKFYLSLAILGWEGLGEMVRKTNVIGEYLKQQLVKNNWRVINSTLMPVACFIDGTKPEDNNRTRNTCAEVVKSGEAWISTYDIGTITTLRACITNYNSGEEEIDKLITLIGKFR